jgi:hypothetical protein
MKFVLFILAVCFCLIGCNLKQTSGPVQVKKLHPTLDAVITGALLPAPPPYVRYSAEGWIRKCLTNASKEGGVPVTVCEVKKVKDAFDSWNATCSVNGVEDLASLSGSTLTCICNALVQISFVSSVRVGELQIFKPRK